ncbi:MAG: glycosyltransferase [Bacteroidia bacterium]
MQNPKVTVSVITYNQAKYVEKALQSVLSQEVDFAYEILIGDDCSTDGTRELLKQFQQSFPDRIRLFLHEKKYQGVPGKLSIVTNLEAAKGEYIALLDGDDWWESNNKLQVQADFLDQHQDFALTFHNTSFLWEENLHPAWSYNDRYHHYGKTAGFTHQEVVAGLDINSSSMMFRLSALLPIPEWYWQVYNGDYAMALLTSRHGKVKYFEGLTCCCFKNTSSMTRVSENSLWANSIMIKQNRAFKKHFKREYAPVFQQRIADLYFKRGFILRRIGKYAAMSAAFARAAAISPTTAIHYLKKKFNNNGIKQQV